MLGRGDDLRPVLHGFDERSDIRDERRIARLEAGGKVRHRRMHAESPAAGVQRMDLVHPGLVESKISPAVLIFEK